MLASVKVLFAAIADYAGLFPPAQLDLPTVIANYAQYQASYDSWMLGRLILPITSLDEFCSLLPSESANPWSLSIIMTGDAAAGLSYIRQVHQEAIAIEALEFPPLPPDEITTLDLPAWMEAFFEIPVDVELEPYLSVLQQKQAGAKIRTGGITASAFPSAAQVCQFILTCAQAQLPFKATAGLHHLLPGDYRLTYEPDSTTAKMYGFFNVALAAAFLYTGKITLAEALVLMQEASSDRFQFTDEAVYWNQRSLNLTELAKVRQQFFRSFGSCSFTEPIADLQAVEF